MCSAGPTPIEIPSGRRDVLLPRLHSNALDEPNFLIFRLVLPGRYSAGPPRGGPLHAEPADLLTAGNDPKLAELFARAELKRTIARAIRAGAIGLDDRH